MVINHNPPLVDALNIDQLLCESKQFTAIYLAARW